MGIIVGFITVLFVPTCILLPVIILLQDSKGEGLSSSAFGGAGSGMQSVLGGQGAATFLSKITTWLAIGFMVMSLFLMRFYGERSGELKLLQQETTQLEETITPAEETAEPSTDAEVGEASGVTDSDGASDTKVDESEADSSEGAGK
jgi:preprotein translocase subunit SecG